VVIVGAGPAGLVAAVTLASPEGALVPLGQPDFAEVARFSPATPAAVPQDHLEPVVRAAAGQVPRSARTAAAWPSALTLCQARSTRPWSSRRKVERRTPTDLRP
jgi:hypothetical protein